MSNALRNVNLRNPSTSQSKQADKRQVQNKAGGYVFQASDKDRFRRFLITGTDGGTYYVSQSDFTDETVSFVIDYISDKGVDAINEAINVSVEGQAPSNNQALFVVALGLNSDNGLVKAASKDAVLKVARTATHLFTLCEYLKNIGGWGSAKTKAIAAWYTTRTDESLSYQVAKYRQRNGWTHRDVLRLSHPKGLNKDVSEFILNGEVTETAPVIIRDFEKLSQVKSAEEAVKAIRSADTVAWEFLPTSVLRDASVWRELMSSGNLPLGAMIRNIRRFGDIGAFQDNVLEDNGKKSDAISGDEFTELVIDALTDEDKIKRARVHPMDILKTLSVVDDEYSNSYYQYSSEREKNVPHEVIDALEDAYNLSFDNVKKIDGSALIGLDVSGSMSWSFANARNGVFDRGANITCATAGASLIQVIMNSMRKTKVMAFSDEFKNLRITKKMSLKEVRNKTANMTFGRTDCSLPMRYALDNGLDVDAFFVITDNETWAGKQHPHEALREYRNKINPNARMFVISMEGTRFTIADPDDVMSYDISGFDSSMMKIVEASFAATK